MSLVVVLNSVIREEFAENMRQLVIHYITTAYNKYKSFVCTLKSIYTLKGSVSRECFQKNYTEWFRKKPNTKIAISRSKSVNTFAPNLCCLFSRKVLTGLPNFTPLAYCLAKRNDATSNSRFNFLSWNLQLFKYPKPRSHSVWLRTLSYLQTIFLHNKYCKRLSPTIWASMLRITYFNKHASLNKHQSYQSVKWWLQSKSSWYSSTIIRAKFIIKLPSAAVLVVTVVTPASENTQKLSCVRREHIHARDRFFAVVSFMTLKLKGDIDILKTYLHTENEVARLHTKLLTVDEVCTVNAKYLNISQGQRSKRSPWVIFLPSYINFWRVVFEILRGETQTHRQMHRCTDAAKSNTCLQQARM